MKKFFLNFFEIIFFVISGYFMGRFLFVSPHKIIFLYLGLLPFLWEWWQSRRSCAR